MSSIHDKERFSSRTTSERSLRPQMHKEFFNTCPKSAEQSASHAQNTHTRSPFDATLARTSAKAALSVALCAGMILPSVMPHAALGQTNQADVDPLIDSQPSERYSAAQLIAQNIKLATSSQEFRSALDKATQLYSHAKAELDEASIPYNAALKNQNDAQRFFDTAQSNAKQSENAFNDALSAHISQAESTAQEAKENLNEATATLAQAQERAEKAEQTYQNALKDAETAASNLSQAQDAAKAATPEALAQAKAELDKANAALTQAQSAQKQAEATYQEALASQSQAEENRDSAAQNLALAQEKKAAADNDVAAATNAYNDAQKALEKAQQKVSEEALAQAQAKIDTAESELSQAKAAQAEAKTAVAQAQTALSEAEGRLDKANDFLNSKKQEATNAEAQVQSAQNAATIAQNNLDNAKQDNADALQAKEIADAAVAEAEKAKEAADEAVLNAQAEKEKADSAVQEAQNALNKINEAINSETEQINKGSVGFIEWMLKQDNLSEAQKADLQKALDVIQNAEKENFSQWYGGSSVDLGEGRDGKVTVVGDPKDATSLENLQRTIAILKKINNLRATDDNFSHYGNAYTNFYFMAIAQTGADRGAGLKRHSLLQTNCENLAFGYADPTMGWYDQEKRSFDQIKEDLGITEINATTLKQIQDEATKRMQANPKENWTVGHYTNLFWDTDQIMGVGFTNYAVTWCYNASSISNYPDPVLYTINEFEALINSYKESITHAGDNLENAQNTLKEAQTIQDEKAALLSAAQEIALAASDTLDQAERKQAEANQTYKDSAAALQKAQTEKDNADQSVTTAQNTLEAANDAIAEAQNEVISKTAELAQTQENLTYYQIAYSEAQDLVTNKEANYQAALNEMGALSESLNNALQQMTNASNNLESSQAAQKQASNLLASAQNALEKADSSYLQATNEAIKSKDALDKQTEEAALAHSAYKEAEKTAVDLQDLLNEVSLAEDQCLKAQQALSHSEDERNTAFESIPAAEEALQKATQLKAEADANLTYAKGITLSGVLENELTDSSYQDLNSLAYAVEQAYAQLEEAEATLQKAAAETGLHSERYVAALLNYNEALETLRLAEAAYQNSLEPKESLSETIAVASFTPNNFQAAEATTDVTSKLPKTADDSPFGIMGLIAGSALGGVILSQINKLRNRKEDR